MFLQVFQVNCNSFFPVLLVFTDVFLKYSQITQKWQKNHVNLQICEKPVILPFISTLTARKSFFLNMFFYSLVLKYSQKL